jgi:hypothetical protein
MGSSFEDSPCSHAPAWEHEAGMHSHAGAWERERVEINI